MAGQRARLRADALLHVAVGGDAERVMVDQVAQTRVQHPFAEREPNRRGDALTERPGGRLDPGREAPLRVTGRSRSELSKAAEVVEGQPVPGEVQQRVEQHRCVSGTQHEAVAVGPVRLLGRMAHDPRKQHVADRRERHRRSGMTRVGLLHRVDRQHPDRVDAEPVELSSGAEASRCGHLDVTSCRVRVVMRAIPSSGAVGQSPLAGLLDPIGQRRWGARAVGPVDCMSMIRRPSSRKRGSQALDAARPST